MERHNYNTRRKRDFILPKPSIEQLKRMFRYSAAQIWNNFSQDLHRYKAKRDPSTYMAIILDGMDQSKTDVPNLRPIYPRQTYKNYAHIWLEKLCTVDFVQWAKHFYLTYNVVI